jgi:hypothetical protein
MCQENIDGAIHQAIGWIRSKRTPGRRRSGCRYVRIARGAFDGINGLTAEGFSYRAICEAFEASGLLPEGSKPYSLSRALRRERARRQKHIILPGTTPVQDISGKKAADKAPTAIEGFTKPEPEKTAAGGGRKLISARTVFSASARHQFLYGLLAHDRDIKPSAI